MDKIQQKINNLRQLKRHYDLMYWQNSEKVVSDEIYDQIHKEFNQLIEQYPEYKIKEDDELESNLMNTNTLIKIHHKNKMYSLGKALNIKEFYSWLNSLLKKLPKQDIEILIEIKIDGLAVCLEYDNGILLQAGTRGDGVIGNDITPIVSQIKDIPKRLDNNFSGFISGEIYMKKSALTILNNKLIAENKKPLKNVRNAASGIVQRRNVNNNDGQHLNFFAYNVFNSEEDYISDMKMLKENNFKTVYNDLMSFKTTITDKNIDKYFKTIEDNRDNLDLDIDGIVIKINDKDIRDLLGEKKSVPNWSIAYKFPPQEKITKLLDVEWELGNKGILTPMAKINPVEIGGSTIKRPTLHNIDKIKEMDIKIGDSIVVSKRGDVIPKVERVMPELRTGEEKEIEILSICPYCKQPTEIDGPFVRCNNINCNGRKKGKILSFKQAMEIDDFGEKIIDKLISNGKLKNINDIYFLKESDLEELDKVKEKLSKKIINNINKSRNQPLWRLITGLSIPNIGAQNAKSLENNFKSLDKLINIKMDDLINISDIGPKIGENIVEWFNDEDNINIVKKFIELNIGKIETKKPADSEKLKGFKIAFTGKLTHFSRNECKEIIEKNSGTPWSIKKEITHLLIGQNAKNDKIAKAESLGAKIITESEFLDILN